MTLEELNKRKTPIVIIDKSLEKYKNIVLFPEKLAKANDVLKRIGLPKLPKQRYYLPKAFRINGDNFANSTLFCAKFFLWSGS